VLHDRLNADVARRLAMGRAMAQSIVTIARRVPEPLWAGIDLRRDS